MCAGVVERNGLKHRHYNDLVGANPITCRFYSSVG